MNRRVTALVGAQFGSEGKGAVVHSIAQQFNIHVRTGGPNAGHTIIHEGRTWKMRSVPCGWVNPEATLIIGAGALIDAELLVDEVNEIEKAGYSVRDRLFVDLNAGIIGDGHRLAEGGTEGLAHQVIGSTGEGVGAAKMARISRRVMGEMPFNQFWQAREDARLLDHGIKIDDTVELMYKSLGEVMLEGTQGSGLSLIHGIYPFVTSSDTNAAQLCADAGVPPADVGAVILVARVNPIRVAGSSGPLHREISWGDLGVEEEVTTVTKKVRRVGHWDEGLFNRAVMLNRPSGVVVTFMDYVFPEIRGKVTVRETIDAWNYASALIRPHGVRLQGIGTGPDTVLWQ